MAAQNLAADFDAVTADEGVEMEADVDELEAETVPDGVFSRLSNADVKAMIVSVLGPEDVVEKSSELFDLIKMKIEDRPF